MVDKRKKYITRVREKLTSELKLKTESFISLGLTYHMGILMKKERANEEFSVDSLQNQISIKPAMILGSPGAGKSTLLLKFALDLCNKNDLVPVHIRFGIKNTYNSLYEVINLPGFSEEEKEELFVNGKLFVIFDGINESELNINDTLENIYELSEKYPDNKFIASCRTLEFPVDKKQYFDSFEILPISEKQIKEHFIKYLGLDSGSSYYSQLTKLRMNYLMDMCRIPLLLSMVVKLLSDNVDGLRGNLKDIDFLSSKTSIYTKFYGHIKLHQQNREYKYDYPELGDDLLMNVAFQMQKGNKVYIGEKDLKNTVLNFHPISNETENLWKEYTTHDKRWCNKTTGYLKKLSFLNLFHVDGYNNYISFIHQSFQDFFAGFFINKMYQTFNDEINEIILDKTKRNWEALEFACCIDSGENVIEKILTCALSEKEQSLLVLVSKCILQQPEIDSKVVDVCCTKMIEAFKFWGIPFDYELIYSTQNLFHHTSKLFPERLKRDINRFSDKYVSRINPIEYPSSYNLERLIEIINIDYDKTSCVDSIYTIGKRKWEKENLLKVGYFLTTLLRKDRVDEDVKEFSIKALKELADYDATPVLLDIINNKKEKPRARAYALNAIASIGNSNAIKAVMNYLCDHSNPYRDSASWSLQDLAIKTRAIDDEKRITEIKEFYYNCLISETNDIEGIFSKGNIVYSLSKLKATEYLEELSIWIKSQTDPYVIEDGLQCLITLGKEKVLDLVLEYTDFNDSVVRKIVSDYVKDIYSKKENDNTNLDYKENSDDKNILILGKDTGNGLEKLKEIQKYVNSIGYNGILIKEQPNKSGKSIMQKVSEYAISSRFVIIENSYPSGHLYELPHIIKNLELTTIVLQKKGGGATWMFEDLHFRLKYMEKFDYEEGSLKKQIDVGIEWANNFLSSFRDHQKLILPWLK